MAFLFVYVGVKQYVNYYFATFKQARLVFEHMHVKNLFEYMEVVSKWLQNKAPLLLQLKMTSKWFHFLLNC